jgi:hypothetical protein
VAALSSIANVETAKPAPYMRQLCKHFGHKNEAEYGESSGSIRFPYGSCQLEPGDGALKLVVSAANDEDLERMERVIGGHLERFGARDGLSVSWERSPG